MAPCESKCVQCFHPQGVEYRCRWCVIGKKKFVYDLWGDSVNVASRMESHGVPGRIQLSEATYLLVKDSFLAKSRGEINIKGKGLMHTYLLERPSFD